MNSEAAVSALNGGASRDKEKATLRRGSLALFATVGRLLDHLEKTEVLKA